MNNRGTCHEFSTALYVLARRVGVDMHIIWGYTQLASGGYGEHYWNMLDISGTEYVFDANVDDSIATARGSIWYYCFCKTYAQIPDQYLGTSRILVI